MSSTRTIQDPAPIDPQSGGVKPDFPPKTIPYPGSPEEMNPQPDHGEETYQGLGRLTDKVALIAGADSGIGRAVAIAFAREGADVALGYLPEEEKDAAESARWIREAGRSAIQVPGDISIMENCLNLANRTVDEFGHIDLLVNIAAYQSSRKELEDITAEDIDRTLKTNVYPLFWLSQAIMPGMRPGSAVINTASIQSYDPGVHLLSYAATKAAVVSMTKTFSIMGMKQGIRVNAVAAGPVWTQLIPATMEEEKLDTFGKKTVPGRPAQPVEIAPVFVFLASDEARYVTGEVYGITGGQTPY